MQGIRLPRRLKKAIKKTFDKLLKAKNVLGKNRFKQVQFLYRETLNYEMAEMLENSMVLSGSNHEAVTLGLRVNSGANLLELRTQGSFSLN